MRDQYNPEAGMEDEGKQSAFNSAMFKMRRLDRLQGLLNEINVNLLSHNPLFGVYNYELKFSCCDQLYQEVESKLTKEEREDGEELREAIQSFMSTNPIYYKVRNEVNRKEQNSQINQTNWAVLKKWLFKYETLVRGLIDDHGMDTKYDDYEDGL